MTKKIRGWGGYIVVYSPTRPHIYNKYTTFALSSQQNLPVRHNYWKFRQIGNELSWNLWCWRFKFQWTIFLIRQLSDNGAYLSLLGIYMTTGQIYAILGHIYGITGHIFEITGHINDITGHIYDYRACIWDYRAYMRHYRAYIWDYRAYIHYDIAL